MKYEYKLYPCRACGGEPELNTDSSCARVHCPGCGSSTGLYDVFEEVEEDVVACERAVAAWNRKNEEVHYEAD